MKKVLMIIGGVVVGAGILFAVVFLIISATSKKMKCKSDEGSITLMYNKKTLTGYAAKNIEFDLDQAKEYAKEVGIEGYLDEFEEWFEANTTGSCSR